MDSAVTTLTNAGWHRQPWPDGEDRPGRHLFARGDRRAYVAPAWTVFYTRRQRGIDDIESVKTGAPDAIDRLARAPAAAA